MELFDKKKIITVFLLVLLWGTVNPVYSETEKERDIKRLLEVSGILDRLSHMQESLLNNVSMMVTAPFPKVPERKILKNPYKKRTSQELT